MTGYVTMLDKEKQVIDQSTTREEYRKTDAMVRKFGKAIYRGRMIPKDARKDLSVLAQRADLYKRIAECTEDGEVAVVYSGMDCDCVKFCHSHIFKAIPLAIDREIEGAYEWADGPMSVGVCKPSERPEAYSRDLAMEAFEDGHQHIVYT